MKLREFRYDAELGSETTDGEAIEFCRRHGHGGNPKQDITIQSRTPSYVGGYDKFVFSYQARPTGVHGQHGIADPNPLRVEIEQILTQHPRTRFAKVLIGMKRGLSDSEMAQDAHAAGEPIRADSVAAVRRIVRMTLDDELVTAPSEAEEQANLYRELLNYPRSQELRQHVTTRLTQLRALGPNVKMTPLGDVRLGANDASQPEKPEPLCPDCNLIHNGECL